MHLMTREAFGVYRRHLRPGGLLLVHISNRYLDLKPVVAAAATEGGWSARMLTFDPSEAGARRQCDPLDLGRALHNRHRPWPG